MKKITVILFYTVLALSNTSCKKFLDINTNPNSATSTTPDLVLPAALVRTAGNVSDFNNYGSMVAGMSANAGGIGGFGATLTYAYSSTFGNGLWSNTYDILEDFQYVINNTNGVDNYAYFNAAAKIMKVYNYQMLVDVFNDIPYTDALKADAKLTPTYDKATDIYPILANLLDSAITIINTAQYPTALTAATDPMFAGNMTTWIKFANTLKLKLIIRASSVITFSNSTFTSAGFLSDDAVVNPGYKLVNYQVNPSWGSWVANFAGSAVNRYCIPTKYAFGYYDGTKLNDTSRGKAIYFGYPNTGINQLGLGDVNTPPAPAVAGSWYSGTGSGTSLGNAIGIMKGPNMGEPLILAAESYFLQAEANVRGIITGTAKTNFNNGITASFKYLYKLPNGSVATGNNYTSDAAAYIATNIQSYLANFDLATTTAQKTEAIITQKYIALNFIHGHEAWNEYRRTKYPISSTVVNGNGYNSFASTYSTATRADHLPTRIPYPSTETSYNAANVPPNINVFSSLIFWAQ